MGIDVLEIGFRIDKEFGVQLTGEVLKQLAVQPGTRRSDIRVGDLLHWIHEESRRRPRCGCGYDLRGHPSAGTCPECGRPFNAEDEEAHWSRLRAILSEVLRVEPNDVRRQSLLIRDLGAT